MIIDNKKILFGIILIYQIGKNYDHVIIHVIKSSLN